MTTKLWIFILAAAVLGAGGYFYYSNHTSNTTINVTSPANSPAGGSPQPNKDDDAERNRKRQEGIGSIKDLKPVEIPNGPAKP